MRRGVARRRAVYNLAADMGGMGFIENNRALCMLSVLINTHLLMAARRVRSRPFFLCLVGVRVRGGQAGGRTQHTTEGIRCVSCDA